MFPFIALAIPLGFQVRWSDVPTYLAANRPTLCFLKFGVGGMFALLARRGSHLDARDGHCARLEVIPARGFLARDATPSAKAIASG